MSPAETADILRQFNEWRRGDETVEQPDPCEIGEAIDAAVEMIDRLEAAESDCLEQARLNGMGASREAALMAKLEAAERERDALRARIEEVERQEPYSYIYEYSNPIDGSPVWRDKPGYWNAQFPKSSKPLYLAPGAQPAPSVPVDLITDYLVSISAHVAHQDDLKAQAEIGELLRMLAAAPEAKP